jgi:hypothetical protein
LKVIKHISSLINYPKDREKTTMSRFVFSLDMISLLPSLVLAGCYTQTGLTHTFYGLQDNDPAGARTAYSCGGHKNIAGGSGSYDDPVTFASARSEFSECEIVYDPYLQKYLRFEDDCAQCETDWDNGNGFMHIDVWVGSSSDGSGQDQINCENDLTPAARSQGIVRSPESGYNVDS